MDLKRWLVVPVVLALSVLMMLGLLAAVPQEVRSRVAAAFQVRTREGNVDKKPARYIKDPNPAWSSIAVNAEHDMVVMTDENLFRVVEYSRLDNTPPQARFTEPKRIISGDQTRMEMLCGAYIDPRTLDVYVTNNDTQDWMPVFSKNAKGNVAPDRLLATPHRSWGITADEVRQELYMTVQFPSAVIVYRKTAANNDAPLRTLEGDATELADPHGITLDMKSDLLIVANHGHRRFYGGAAVSAITETWEEWIGKSTADLNTLPRRYLPGLGKFDLPSINIYARGASGNAPPLRVIKGAKTQLNWPSHIAVHEDRGEIFVANDADDSILVFRTSDNGDVAPTRIIKGPKTRVKNPTGLSLDVKNGELWVANMANYSATVFPITANGDVAPLRVIRGGPANQIGLMIGNPGAVGYDSKRQQILVPN
jgi:DNA-binding beta-propeller fold protein YncE